MPLLRRRKLMKDNKKTGVYKLTKEDGVRSKFDFGVRWCDVNKIVLIADNITNIRNNMFFATFGAEWIGINERIMFIGLSNGKSNLSFEQIVDGKKHEIEFTFDNTPSKNIISNFWDIKWSKKISYYRISFYKDDILIADFIPDETNSDRMLNTVTGEYITASILAEYKLEKVE